MNETQQVLRSLSELATDEERKKFADQGYETHKINSAERRNNNSEPGGNSGIERADKEGAFTADQWFAEAAW